MKNYLLKITLIFTFFLISSCESENRQSAAINEMLAAMGGLENLRAVDSFVQKGSGIRLHLGQIPEAGGSDPVGQINNLIETIDLENGRAAFDNDIVIGGGFSQHRTEAFTNYQGQKIAWGTTEGRPNIATSVNGLFSWATHNTPEMLLRRNSISIALSALNATGGDLLEASIDGTNYHLVETTLNGEDISLYLDMETMLLVAYGVLDTETMWGDQEALYLLGDYRRVDNLLLPFSLEITHPDEVYGSIQYEEITINNDEALSIFDVPEEIREQADQVISTDGSWVPLEWNQVADNVIHVVAFSHHSMIVEFADYVAIVEGPYTEAQSLRLVDLIEERLFKPVRFVIPTHPHYDHTGGIRGLASVGATVLVAAGHEGELRMIVESPHTNPPDALSLRLKEGGEIGQIEVFEGMTIISDNGQSLELYEEFGIPHVSPKVLAYVPGANVLFQSDLFFGAPSADASALYQAIVRLELEVEQIVGGHGGVLPFSSLQAAATEGEQEQE